MYKKQHYVAVAICASILAPVPALAAVQITEIMYDPPGVDTGHEWVEITNTGDSAVDITGYKFFEANTNHGLSVVSGSANLSPGASAIIVEDAAKFGVDWPNVSATIVKSSFSLSNTGEALAIKDSTLTVVDSVSYDSAMGGSGDGNSLHRVPGQNSFTAGVPSPGVQQGGAGVVDALHAAAAVQAAGDTTTPAPTSGSGSNAADPLAARITTTSVAMVGGGSFFTGVAYTPQGAPIAAARYLWTFGDGATAEGQTVFHTYTYPGTYAVVLTVAANLSSGMAQTKVQAMPAQIGMLVEPDGSVVLLNQSPHDVTVGVWSVSSGTSTFVIPKDTIILGNQNVRLSVGVLGLRAGSDTVLRYPNGSLAASVATSPNAPLVLSPAPAVLGSSLVSEVSTVPAVNSQEAVLQSQHSNLNVPALVPPTTTETIAASPVATARATGTQAAAAATSGFSVPLDGWLLALAALVTVGAAGSLYAGLHASSPQKETFPEAEEFDIE